MQNAFVIPSRHNQGCQVSRGRQIKATINGASKKRLVVYGYVARFPHGRRNERRNHVDPLVKIEISERSEEHTSELQSLMRISYAVFCLKKKTTTTIINK